VAGLARDIGFNTAEVLCGVPVHYFFEHAASVFTALPFDVARSAFLEEAEESVFVPLMDRVHRIAARRQRWLTVCREVGCVAMEHTMVGCPGPLETNRRYGDKAETSVEH
jgi:hypothetical protein